MRATLALIRKDWMWLLAFLLGGTGIATLALFRGGYVNLFVLPYVADFGELLLGLSACAVVLGTFAASREDLGRTRDWLQHRPVTHGQAFWVRALACASIVLAWPILGTTVLMLHESTFGLGLECTSPRQLEILATVGADALTFLAFGLFALTLPVFLVWRLLLLALSLGVVLLVGTLIDSLSQGPGSLWHISIRILFAAGLLAAAAACNRRRYDPDLPPHRTSLLAGMPIVLAITFVCGELGAACFEYPGLVGLAQRRPMVMRVAPEELALVSSRPSNGGARFDVLDSTLVRDGRSLARGEFLAGPSPFFGDSSEPYEYYGRGRRWMCIVRPEGIAISDISLRTRGVLGRFCILEPGGSFATVLDLESDARRCWLLERPPDARSREAFLLLGGRERSEMERGPLDFAYRDTEILLVDPTGGGVHLLRSEGVPTWTPVPLPDGDRPRRKDAELLYDGQQVDGLASEKGRWVRLGGEWRAATSLHTDPAMTMDVLDRDPLGPEIEVRTRDGLTLHHRFTLVTTDDRVFASLACIGAILRPAPSAILATLRPHGIEGHERALGTERPSLLEAWWPFDPLLSSGHAWLLAPNLALTAALMALTFRILRRRGASNRRALCWAGAVLLTGVLGLVLFSAFEPKRAWRRAELSEQEPARIRAA